MIRYKSKELNRDGKWVTKWHKTHGKFNNWTTGGAFGFTYAAIKLKSSVMFIPRHDIHPDDLATLEQVQA